MAFNTGSALSGAASGAATGSVAGPWGAVIGGAAGALLGGFGGGGSKKQRVPQYASWKLQRTLPTGLRYDVVDPIIKSGLGGIADLIARPGRLSSSVSDAIAPRLAVESGRIARDFTGLRQNTAGSLARGNAPVSIKSALDAALGTQEMEMQGGARREALMDSDILRRQDLGETYNVINALLAAMGKGQAMVSSNQDLQATIGQQRDAANTATIAALMQGLSNMPKHLGKKPGPD